MVFSSMTFLPLFLPLVILPYFLVRSLRAKNAILLAFSLLFYAWGEPKWILVMLLTVTVNYIAGLLIDRAKTEGARRLWMIVGVAVSLAFLVFFKYTRFFADMLLALFSYKLPFAYTKFRFVENCFTSRLGCGIISLSVSLIILVRRCCATGTEQ